MGESGVVSPVTPADGLVAVASLTSMIPITAVETWCNSLPLAAHSAARKRLTDLAQAVIDHRVQFLCGAGMSKASGLPLSSQLGVRMAKRLLLGNEDAPDVPAISASAGKFSVETIAEAYVHELGSSELNRLIERVVQRGTGKAHAGHKALEFLASQSFIDRLYTTNFDTLLEEGLGERGTAITDSDQDLRLLHEIQEGRKGAAVPVLHLHGVVGRECLFLESNTHELDRPLAKLMTADMVTHSFVWVGYSLTDLDLRRLFLALREMLARHDRENRPFVVYPLTTDATAQESEWQLADQIWKARGCHYLPGAAEVLLPALVSKIRRLRSDASVRKLVIKAGGDPENATEIATKTDEIAKVVAVGVGDFDDTVEDLARQEGVL